jgi:hypothetical protein
MTYFPHGKYPAQKTFNVIDMMPGIFRKIKFEDFCTTIGDKRMNDCFDGIIFLYSSKYQENDGAKLVMMFSAIERSCGKWQPLEIFLNNKDLKKQLVESSSGKVAYDLLEKNIERYLDKYGSTRSIVKFFRDNLSTKEKMIFTGAIRRSFVYRKKTTTMGSLYSPDYQQKQESINKELGRLIKNFIYHIRNGFVHNADYFIIPNEEYIKSKKILHMDIFEKGLPKEHWVTVLSFEKLHELFCNAFTRFWRKEFKKMKHPI